MDPISAIFVMAVLGGLVVKGVDVATDGLLSAEVGAGVRGAGAYGVRAGRARWRLARTKAREIRQRTPQGRAVQEVLDLSGLFARVLFGEARRFGSGLRSEWETARDQARSARTERRGDEPWPIVRAARSGAVRAREWAERLRETRTGTPSETDPNDPNTPERNGNPSDPRGAVMPNERPPGLRGQQCPKDDDHPGHVWTSHLVDPDGEPVWCQGISGSFDRSGRPDGSADPLPSTVPDANGDVKCGCCALLHKPLPPGEHCPNCHIHDAPNAPTDTTPNTPTTKGPSMADINTAPAAIAAWEAFGARWESLQSRADALQGEHDALKNEVDAFHGEVAALADGMGDFAIGGETDAAAAVGELSDSATSAKEQVDNLVGSMSTAKEGVDAYTDALHLEYDGPIEAAAGKAADVHSVMQEA